VASAGTGATKTRGEPVGIDIFLYFLAAWRLHCKKELAIFPSPAGMSLTKLSLGGKKRNFSSPGRV
jgi:hypothetical protein